MSRILRTNADPVLSSTVEYHGFVYTSGIVPRDTAADLAGQTHDVLAQIDTLLETHGTDKTRLLQAHIYLKSMADRAAFNEIWKAWLPEGGAPARACVQAVMADPGFLVEVMITACK